MAKRRTWDGTDWSLSTSAIAKARGVTIPTVSQARRRYAPETLAAYAGRNPGRANRGDPTAARAQLELQANLEQHRAALRDANTRIEDLHKQLREALDRAHRFDAELDRLRRAQQAPPPPPPPNPKPAPHTPRAPIGSPATYRALADALEQHPDFAEALAGTLTDAWHNPGAASGVETHDHP